MASSSSSADVSITREQLTKYFHLPITDVAKELGICATMLKKICRKNGIPRWPHRKIKSLNKMIESLEASLPNDGSEAGECIRQEIIILKNKKSLIMRNPSILGNSNKRANEGDELSSTKKQRTDTTLQQGPVTTFTNPKASLASTTPNSFSINTLLTPSSNFTPSSALVGSAEEKDYRAYAHHHPHLSSIPPPFPHDASRGGVDSKHIEGRTSAGFSSYLPEDDARHLEASPLLHPPSTDPYYYHKAQLASQYQSYHYPRQMLPPSYPPPPHALSASPHHTRNPYYHPFASHDSPRQQQQHLIAPDAAGEQANQQTEQEQDRTQQGQNGHPQTTQTQQLQSSPHTQKQQTTQQMQRLQQSLQQGQESLPKMTSSDLYKYRNPPSPTTHQPSPYSQGADLGYFYPQYHSQQQRLHPQ